MDSTKELTQLDSQLVAEAKVAASLVWTCPIDGLSISSMLSEQLGDPENDPHIHLIVDDQKTCAHALTPHTWKIKADIIVEKVP